jgi:hypothetical protein
VIRALMPDLTTYNKFRIPGGWVIVYGEYSIDAERERHYVSKLLAEHGHDVAKAQRDARQRIQDLAGGEEQRRIQEFVMRCADDYAKRFPDLKKQDRTLAGFDPASLQDLYLPGRKSTGRDGLPALRLAMAKMAATARRAMYDYTDAPQTRRNEAGA